MMRLSLFVLLVLSLGIYSPNPCHAIFPTGKLTVAVVGEDGIPVEGARIGIGFDDARKQSKENSVVCLTDGEGICTASETTTSGYVGFTVTKAGYYETAESYLFKERNLLRWEPWNPVVKAVLRKIENPVPMYARDTRVSVLEIPVIGQSVGFDLIKFDWVAPHGLGTQADFIFHLERLPEVSRNNYEATLSITFQNKNDGIQMHREILENGSQYKLPRTAPEDGYSQKLVLQESFKLGVVKRNFNFLDDDINYIFRIRSIEKDGKLERAMYGKIIKYISFSAMKSKTAKIYLKYYLNPDYTRNLEFDPKRNMFLNLPELERVMQP